MVRCCCLCARVRGSRYAGLTADTRAARNRASSTTWPRRRQSTNGRGLFLLAWPAAFGFPISVVNRSTPDRTKRVSYSLRCYRWTAAAARFALTRTTARPRRRVVFAHLCRHRFVNPNCLRAITSIRIGSRRSAISSLNSDSAAAPARACLQFFQLKAQINALESAEKCTEKDTPPLPPIPAVLNRFLCFAGPTAAPAANYRSASPCETPSSGSASSSRFMAAQCHLFRARAISRFATAGSFALLLRRACTTCFVKISASPCRAASLKRLLHHAVFREWYSASRTVLQDLLWRGSEKETARVPPSLDSPLSAAPETFLSRDAVSAFPIAFGPLPQPLPGARYRVSAALERLPWRFFWNRAHPLRGRANRPAPFSGHRFTISSAVNSASRRLLPCACSADQLRGTKIPRSGWSSCMLETPKSAKTPSTLGIPNSCAASAILENGDKTQLTFDPNPASNVSWRDLQRLFVPVQADQPAGRHSFGDGLPNGPRLPAWRRRRFRPVLFAAIAAPLPTSPAYVARSSLSTPP